MRLLVARPGFTSIAILTLALGIGANMAIFKVMNALLLKSLPVSHPEELLLVKSGKINAFTNPLWEELRDHQDVFSGIFAWGTPRFNLADSGEARFVSGLWVSGEFFSTLGVQAVMGRNLTPDDDRPGAIPVAELSYALWQREYSGRPDTIGQQIRLDGHSFEIVGVSPPEFFGVEPGRRFDAAVPIADEPMLAGEFSKLHRASNYWLNVMGRPKTGLTPAQVNARLNLLSPQILAAAAPLNMKGSARDNYLQGAISTAPASGGVTYLRTRYRQPLMLLLGVTGLVLLIACANVANLLLARAAVRRKEIGVRLAMGASRMRLIQQLVTECLLLAVGGAVSGVLLATWASHLLVAQISTPASPIILDSSVDLRVALLVAAVALATTFLFGFAPALVATRVSLNSSIKENDMQVSKSVKFSLASTLVVVQVCLSVVLVVGAGLLLRTFHNLLTLDPGFDSEHVLVANLDFRKNPAAGEQRRALYDVVLDHARSAPGVADASLSDVSPISGSYSTIFVHPAADESNSSAGTKLYANLISPGYFQTMGTRLMAGRDFRASDAMNAPKVAILNETAAHNFFGLQSPVGKIIYETGSNDPVEIVGLVQDTKYVSLREEMPATLYRPLSQDPLLNVYCILEVRSLGNPAALIPQVRDAIAEGNAGASISFNLLKDQLAQSLPRERMMASLAAVFGALALVLSALGLYGLISYSIARRWHEIGIRIALGATRGDIFRLVLHRGFGLTLTGVLAGVLCATIATRLLKTFLYGVQTRDPLTFVGVSVLLIAVTVAACGIPARRATKVDPAAALRSE
jgi:predicted permease